MELLNSLFVIIVVNHICNVGREGGGFSYTACGELILRTQLSLLMLPTKILKNEVFH